MSDRSRFLVHAAEIHAYLCRWVEDRGWFDRGVHLHVDQHLCPDKPVEGALLASLLHVPLDEVYDDVPPGLEGSVEFEPVLDLKVGLHPSTEPGQDGVWEGSVAASVTVFLEEGVLAPTAVQPVHFDHPDLFSEGGEGLTAVMLQMARTIDLQELMDHVDRVRDGEGGPAEGMDLATMLREAFGRRGDPDDVDDEEDDLGWDETAYIDEDLCVRWAMRAAREVLSLGARGLDRWSKPADRDWFLRRWRSTPLRREMVELDLPVEDVEDSL